MLPVSRAPRSPIQVRTGWFATALPIPRAAAATALSVVLAFSVNSSATVQAIVSAFGYTDSSVGTAIVKFRTPAATYPITVNVIATATGSSKRLQLSPVVLTLIVN